MSEKLFAMAAALSTMVMAIVLMIVLIALITGCSICGWLSIEIANTPIPTPWY